MTERVQQTHGDSIKKVLPVAFFKVKEELTPKAPLRVLLCFTLIGWILLLALFGILVVTSYNTTTTLRETIITAGPSSELMNCTALAGWGNKLPSAADLTDYRPVKTSGGIEVKLYDMSMTTAQCFDAIPDGVCEAWADDWMGKSSSSCCLAPTGDTESPCYRVPSAGPDPLQYPPSPPAWPGYSSGAPSSPPYPPPPPESTNKVDFCGGFLEASHMYEGNDRAPHWCYSTGGTKSNLVLSFGTDASASNASFKTLDSPSAPADLSNGGSGNVYRWAAATSTTDCKYYPYDPNDHLSHYAMLASENRSMLVLSTCKSAVKGSSPYAVAFESHCSGDYRDAYPKANPVYGDNTVGGLDKTDVSYATRKLRDRSGGSFTSAYRWGGKRWAPITFDSTADPVFPDDISPLLPRATFVADCNLAIKEMCSQMDTRTAPFACIKETIVRKTVAEVFSVALANTQAAASILFAVFAVRVTRVKKQEEKKEEKEQAMTAAPRPEPPPQASHEVI